MRVLNAFAIAFLLVIAIFGLAQAYRGSDNLQPTSSNCDILSANSNVNAPTGKFGNITTDGTIAGNVTGTVTGHATLDLPLAGGTMSGAIRGNKSASFGNVTASNTFNSGNASIGGTLGVTGKSTVGTIKMTNMTTSGSATVGSDIVANGKGKFRNVTTPTVTCSGRPTFAAVTCFYGKKPNGTKVVFVAVSSVVGGWALRPIDRNW